MDAIVLEPGLRTWLEQDAQQEGRDVDDLINEAVARYLRERQQTKLDREIAAYQAMHEELLREHAGEWVAIHRRTLTGLSALVDTGADVTIVPTRFIEPLDLQADNRKILRSPWGERRPVNVYLLDVGIGAIRLPLMEIVADDRDNEVIMGRNVLNRLRLVLDGPRQLLEL